MLVVVGGHSRNIGKTTAMETILRAVPEADWWAFKITQYGHGVCADDGAECGCVVDAAHPFAIDEEPAPSPTDSGRYLGAGARRAFWVRTATGELGHAIPDLRKLLVEAPHALLESNSVLDFLIPDLYLPVIDFTVQDLKPSARRYLNRADAFIVTGGGDPWPDVPARWLAKPWLTMEQLGEFVQSKLSRDARS